MKMQRQFSGITALPRMKFGEELRDFPGTYRDGGTRFRRKFPRVTHVQKVAGRVRDLFPQKRELTGLFRGVKLRLEFRRRDEKVEDPKRPLLRVY